jgi:hypothetical protein
VAYRYDDGQPLVRPLYAAGTGQAVHRGGTRAAVCRQHLAQGETAATAPATSPAARARGVMSVDPEWLHSAAATSGWSRWCVLCRRSKSRLQVAVAKLYGGTRKAKQACVVSPVKESYGTDRKRLYTGKGKHRE